jgi:serine/threonine-protein kinase
VFFECVTGRTPYRATTTEAYRTQHTIGEIPAEDAPAPVRALIQRGLAKHPGGRPAGALQFAAELEAAATAAYGPEWESNGWRRLAEAAAGLVALFPLAALVSSTAPGAAGHLSGAAAGKAAAATGRGVLTKVFGANAATKVVAVATGVLVVGGAGTAAIVVSRHKPKPKPLRVELASYSQPVSGLDLRNSRYVRVNGVKDPTVQRRVNAALLGPLDWAVDELRQQTAQANPPCTKPTVLNARPELGLRGPRLITVRYELPKQTCFPLDYELPHVTVTVDVRTGKALTADEVFRPETLTPDGLATLWKRVSPHTTQPDLTLVCVRPPLLRKDFSPGEPFTTKRPQPPRISPFFTPTGVAMTWSHVGSECPYFSVTVPYTEVRDLLNPKIVAELPK